MLEYNALGAGMAQLVEQLIRNQQVAGSSPATSSKKSKSSDLDFFIRLVNYTIKCNTLKK